jgi:hypothetical protein
MKNTWRVINDLLPVDPIAEGRSMRRRRVGNEGRSNVDVIWGLVLGGKSPYFQLNFFWKVGKLD